MKLLRSVVLAVSVGLVVGLCWKARRSTSVGEPATSRPLAQPSLPLASSGPAPTSAMGESPRVPQSNARAPAAGAFFHAKLRALLDVKTGDTEGRYRLLRELSERLTDENAEEITRCLSPDEFQTAFGTAALERWLRVDASSAARWIAERSDATDEHAWLVARSLLARPGALAVFGDTLPSGNFRQQLFFAGGLEALKTSPRDAIAFAEKMATSLEQTNLLQTIAFDWAIRSPEQALAWMSAVPDPPLRENLVAVGAKAIAVTDPDLAAQWLTSAVKTKSLLNETAMSLVETWAANNPSQAAAWLTHFPTPEVREAGANIVLRRWAEFDPKAAAVWLVDFPEGEKVLATWRADQAKANAKPEE